MSRLAFDRPLVRCALRGWTKGKPTTVRSLFSLSLSRPLPSRRHEDQTLAFRFDFWRRRRSRRRRRERFRERTKKEETGTETMFARALSSSGYFGETPCAEIGRVGRCKFEKLKGNEYISRLLRRFEFRSNPPGIFNFQNSKFDERSRFLIDEDR